MKFSIAMAAVLGAAASHAFPSAVTERQSSKEGSIAPAAKGPMTFNPVSLEDAKKKMEDANSDTDDDAKVQTDAVSFGAETSLPACGNVRTRTEWRAMSGADQDAYLGAVKCLIAKAPSGQYQGSTNRFEDFAFVHQQSVNNVHQSAIFFPWHRLFLHAFEKALQDECGYAGMLPWWDEVQDAGNFAGSPLFAGTDKFGHIPSGSSPVCMEQTGVR